MAVRMAAVAGQFYDSSPEGCRRHIEELLPAGPIEAELPQTIVAGIVPHAGWVFSGAAAALVFAAVKQKRKKVDSFVLFGAVHSVRAPKGLLYDRGQWGSPLGTIEVDEELSEAIGSARSDLIQVDCAGHSREHSIEVQVPFIQHLFAGSKIVPLMVPPMMEAGEIGEAVAEVIAGQDKEVVCIGSTDLTHYGPSYFFTPRGTGAEANRWAKEENDKFFLELVLSMQAERLVDTAQTYSSACGAGAVAATVAAAGRLGAEKGYLLAHTSSAEVVAEKYGSASSDSVGYAAVVFG